MTKVPHIFSHTHALRLLISRELSSRYKGTILGIFWLFLQPLMMVVVYSFVFSVIMKVRIPGMENSYHFALYLMAAMMPFFAFQEAILAASNSLFAGSSLLHKSTLPAVLIPLVPMLSTVVTELIALVIIVIATFLLLEQVSWYLLLLPVLVLIRLCLSLAIGYMVATLSVFIQDLRQALGLLLTMLMFLTPILYPVSMIPAQFLPMNNLNPLYHLLDAYRAVILRGELPDIGLVYVAGFAVVLLFIGVYFFQKSIARAKDFV
ncbi:ABC transporter permease [Methyloprofundus sp.]|uniref:ABC transporter permease n=1 Tax=Methyloprofundus sp. TaxID=2020875 RepID=UPI003D13870C